MRVLIGPSRSPVGDGVRAAAPDAAHEFIGFGDGAEIACDPLRDDFDDILARLPAGWLPDLTIFCSPEYHPVPRGIEDGPGVTAAILGDWNLGGQALHQAGPMFDILASDLNGCDRIRAAGYENVVYVPFFSHDPKLAYRMPDVERDLDVVMIGNFHGEIHRERAPWVARVAALSHRHKVVVTSGVFGFEYCRLMNRAKIVFNRSIRGEINMRVYEAAACGALLFYERENREIRDLFADGEEVVLYGDDDLEDLLEHYLARPAERERIAGAPHAKVQRHTPALKTLDITQRIAAAMGGEEGLAHGRRVRRFHSLPPAEQALGRARQWLLCANRRVAARAAAELAGTTLTEENHAAIAATEGAALACLAAQAASRIERARLESQARSHLHAAIRLGPSQIAPRLNLAALRLATGDRAGARALLRETVHVLELKPTGRPELEGAVLPRAFSAPEVDTELAWVRFHPDSEDWAAEMKRIHLWRAHEMLAEIAYEEGDFAAALTHGHKVASLAPERGSACLLHARCLLALGFAEEAAAEYAHAIAHSPLEMLIRIELARLFMDVGDNEQAEQVLRGAERIVEGAPCLESARADLQAVRDSAHAEVLVSRGIALLALPNWSDRAGWQSLIESYARAFTPADSITLRLRVEPDTDPEPHQLVADILDFATTRLGIAAEDLPDIDLAAERLAPEERWKLYLEADALVSLPGSAENMYARARSLPVISPDDFPAIRRSAAQAASRRSESIPCLST